jgi:hypothetical protein
VPAQLLDEVRPAEHQPALRPAEQLVAGRGHQVGAGPQGGGRGRLVGQPRVRRQQPRPDVHHHGHWQGRELGDRHGRRETGDQEVRGVHLQHERGLVVDRSGVVREPHPVRRTHLAEARTHRLQQLGDPEAVADLDQLPARHHDGATRRERAGDQGECRGPVVDDVHAPGVGHGGGERCHRGTAAPAAAAGGEVELHVGRARRHSERVHGGRRQRGPAEVGVHEHAGGVDDPAQGGGHRGQVGERGRGHVVGVELAGAAPVQRAGHGLLDEGTAEPSGGLDQPRVGEHVVGAGRVPPRVLHDPPPPMPAL